MSIYIYILYTRTHTHTHMCVCVYVYRWRPWLGDPNAAEFAHGGTEADGYSEAAQAGMQFVSCVCGGVYVCVHTCACAPTVSVLLMCAAVLKGSLLPATPCVTMS